MEAGEGDRETEDLPSVLPWWEGDGLGGEGMETAPEPEMISPEVISGISPPEGTGLKLAYNAIAIWCVIMIFPSEGQAC